MNGGRTYRWGLLGVIACAAALHLHEVWSVEPISTAAGWFAWGMVPYLVCVVASVTPVGTVPASAAAVLVLAWDMFTYYSVFIEPQSSTAALALVFVPLWNGILVAPLALGITWWFRRHKQRERHAR
jgi:hypothetical protein